jgi:glycerol-3-phosphate dehydrogenase
MALMREKIERQLQTQVGKSISCREWHSSVILEGETNTWDDVVRAGRMAAHRGYKGVVNRLTVPGLIIPEIKKPLLRDSFLEGRHVDVLVIGGGIIGCAIARELSKWNISVLLVDKEDDVAMHTTSRNDGMVHPGFEPKPGTKKALCNVRGNQMYDQIAKELDIPFHRTGSTILYNRQWMRALIPAFQLRARQNGVAGARYMPLEELRKREPFLSGDIAGALYLPSTAHISPYKTAVAYAENAVMNGAEVCLNTIVTCMEKQHGRIVSVQTNRGRIVPRIVINAAGVCSDLIADMADDQFFSIHPRKGQTAYLDKKKGYLLYSVVAMPSIGTVHGTTKGGGLVKTVDGNILVGPDAQEQPLREDYTTCRDNMQALLAKHLPLIPRLSPADVINYSAGVRAATYEEDFIIEASEYVENLVHAAGIQSPGLASAPAIAEDIENIACALLSKEMQITPRPDWNPIRKAIPHPAGMSEEARSALIRLRPEYGRIVCRCEEVSKGEIIDAIHSPVPARSLDAVKRRVRAGMGRCQGGFCQSAVMRILCEQTGTPLDQITKKGRDSVILAAETKQPEEAQTPQERNREAS